MLRQDTIAIARLKKVNSTIKFVALVPQEETILESETIPPGFNLVFLPYADDI